MAYNLNTTLNNEKCISYAKLLLLFSEIYVNLFQLFGHLYPINYFTDFAMLITDMKHFTIFYYYFVNILIKNKTSKIYNIINNLIRYIHFFNMYFAYLILKISIINLR